jgi:hypothetical protein
MEWWQQIPSGVWQLPAQVLVIVLLSLGVFVTKREHANMTKLMEYFRTVAENKETTILNQAKALEVYKDVAPLLKEVLEGVRKIAKEKRDDVSSKEEA